MAGSRVGKPIPAQVARESTGPTGEKTDTMDGMQRDGRPSRQKAQASAPRTPSLLLVFVFISGCGSSALSRGVPNDGSPPDQATDQATTNDDPGAPDSPSDGPTPDDRPFSNDVSVARDVPISDEEVGSQTLDAGPVDVALGPLDATAEVALDGSWPLELVDPFGQLLRLAWCGDERMDWSQSIKDDQVVGTGACANTTVAQLIDRVLALFQSDAGYRIGGCVFQGCAVDNSIQILRYGEGFRLILVSSSLLPGLHAPIECNYFETDADCLPVAVGHFSARQSIFKCEGAPLWGYPLNPLPVYCDSSWPGCGVDGGIGGG